MDPELVRAAQGGDAFAIDELIEALYPLVRRVSRRSSRRHAEDATQEALLAIFRDLPTLRAPEAIVSWACVVAARVATRMDRTRGGERVVAAPLDAERIPSWADNDALDVSDVLARLPSHHSTILVLHDLQGFSEREIAEMTGVALGTVKSRVSRARERFREEWNR